MTDEEYHVLLKHGKQLAMNIIDELNRISDARIRTDRELWRREQDFQELCVALAIFEERSDG